jgi:hypothetical protein
VRLTLPCAALCLACTNEGQPQVVPPVVLGLPDTTVPTYDDARTRVYESFLPVTLPVRRARDAELTSGDVTPYPRPPFHLATDTHITARFTVSNLDAKPQVVELLIDPWNEFVRYSPRFFTREGAPAPDLSGIDRKFTLGPNERIAGELSPDDMSELATDLATVMQLAKTPPTGKLAGAVLYNRAFDLANRSTTPDPELAPFVPKTVAGLVGFDVGLRTFAPGNVAIELVLNVEDVHGDRVIPAGETTRRAGRPAASLTPPDGP